MKISDLAYWQVFLYRMGNEPGYEHVILPRSTLELLEKDHVIGRAPSNSCKVPVDAVRLISMSWVQVEGDLPISPASLRTHDNAYRQGELTDLRRAAKRLDELSPTGRVPAQPPPPENLSRKQIEKLVSTPKWKPPTSPTAPVDMRCLADKATLQLFSGTSIARDIAEGSVFGLRALARRAKAAEDKAKERRK